MSLDISGLKYLIPRKLKIEVSVPKLHPMIILAKNLPWEDLAGLVTQDLYKDCRRSGRKLNLRLHLGAFLLQSQNKWTDRVLEDMLRFHGPSMIFCGLTKSSQGLDHSQYTRFRNRLSEQTAMKLSSLILQEAQSYGFTDSNSMDLDSTVQESNICYPSDISMMRKLAQKSEKILNYFIEQGSTKAAKLKSQIDFKKIGKDVKGYFFVTRGEDGQLQKKNLLKKIESAVTKAVKKVGTLSGIAGSYEMPWNLKKDWQDVTDKGVKLLSDIRYFIRNQKMKEGKILSLGRDMVTCIRKGKVGKLNEFGRQWFVAKLKGHYAFGFSPREEVRLHDSEAFELGLKHFNEIFSSSPLSVAADQGFWSDDNIAACLEYGVEEIGIHPRGKLSWLVDDQDIERLRNRRASTEGTIGHIKLRGMGKSKMKSDDATLLEGQRAILSLNLSRFTKDLTLTKLRCAG